MSIKTELLFSQILNKNFKFVRDVRVLLDVEFPLLFSFDADNNKSYLAYVTEFKRRKKKASILFVETNNDILFKLLDQKISLRKALMSHEIRQLSTPLINEEKDNLDDGILPSDNFYLNTLLPNKIDIEFQKRLVEQKLYATKQYVINVGFFLEEKDAQHLNFKARPIDSKTIERNKFNYFESEKDELEGEVYSNIRLDNDISGFIVLGLRKSYEVHNEEHFVGGTYELRI